MTIDVFEKLYESLVEQVFFTQAGFGGFRIIEKYKLSQIKRLDISLAVENVRLMCSCYVKSKTEVFRMWIKLRNVSDDRLLKTFITGRSVIHVVGKLEC